MFGLQMFGPVFGPFYFVWLLFCFVRRRVLSGRRHDVFCSDVLFGDFSPEISDISCCGMIISEKYEIAPFSFVQYSKLSLENSKMFLSCHRFFEKQVFTGAVCALGTYFVA